MTKNNQISNFMKIHPVEAELFLGEGQKHGGTDGGKGERRDGQTDMTKLIVAFRNYAKVPKTSNIPLNLSHLRSL